MTRTLTVLIVSLFFAAATSAAGKPNNQEKRDNQKIAAAKQDVAEAEKKLVEESQQVRAAAAELAKAEAAAAVEARHVADCRKRAEERSAERFELAPAAEAVTAAQAEVAAAAKPLLEKLRESPSYREAKQTADAAAARLQGAVPESEAVALRDAVLVPIRLEREALESDRTTAERKATLDARLEQVAAIRTRMQIAVENDSETLKALDRLNAAKKVVDKAEQKLAAERASALAALRKLNQEKVQLQRAVVQDKRNDGQNKKPPPKKGNKM